MICKFKGEWFVAFAFVSLENYLILILVNIGSAVQT